MFQRFGEFSSGDFEESSTAIDKINNLGTEINHGKRLATLLVRGHEATREPTRCSLLRVMAAARLRS